MSFITQAAECKDQPDHFAFSKDNQKKIKEILKKYPKDRKHSAVMPLLDLAQRQHQNWLPRVAMDEVARLLDMPPIKVYEVATFYTMYNLKPVGKHHIQLCTTTPCMLCGSNALLDVIREELGIKPGEMTKDGKFTLAEVECLGACANAPMAQINDDYYEDLSPDNFKSLLNDLSKDKKVKTGSQTGRQGACPIQGATTLVKTDAAKAKSKAKPVKKKAVPKKTVAKKLVAKKSPVKKAAVKKTPAKKTTTKKRTKK